MDMMDTADAINRHGGHIRYYKRYGRIQPQTATVDIRSSVNRHTGHNRQDKSMATKLSMSFKPHIQQSKQSN